MHLQMLFMVDWHKEYIATCHLVDVIVLLRLMCLLLNSDDCTLANITVPRCFLLSLALLQVLKCSDCFVLHSTHLHC